MPFVIDNSIVCSWLIENQASDYGDAVAQRLLDDRAHMRRRCGSSNSPTSCAQPACGRS
jgi:hypothetical protein